ncbi:MAG: hypothetical protein ACPGFC_04005 [Paracoccaceae bacterium]
MTQLPPHPVDLSLQISGITLPHDQMRAALTHCGSAFAKDDFDAALRQACGTPIPARIIGRALQALKRKGVVRFDTHQQRWCTVMQLVPQPAAPLPQTLPLTSLNKGFQERAVKGGRLDRVAEHVRLTIGALACVMLLIALIGLNASFAWELGREAAQFQVLFTMGVMALDMMRPGFVMMGCYLLGTSRAALGSLALAVALLLSPVSILSTTSILSASFLLGAELGTDAADRADTRDALRHQHAQLMQRAAREEAAWRAECQRGGCGPRARKLEGPFQDTLTEAQALLNQVVALTGADAGHSELLSRLVATFEDLGLFGHQRQIWLPLFLAISLEVGALLGPTILMRRRASSS